MEVELIYNTVLYSSVIQIYRYVFLSIWFIIEYWI